MDDHGLVFLRLGLGLKVSQDIGKRLSPKGLIRIASDLGFLGMGFVDAKGFFPLAPPLPEWSQPLLVQLPPLASFLYDIFWVFGTNVMATVAKYFEAPIKLVFPQDLLEKGVAANNFAMLGLRDIAVPGIFIALLLKFDMSLKHNSKFYFYSTFVAYLLGLVATIFVMHMFKHAQPALLYLVPTCLGTPLSLALIKGDISAMFQYEDHPEKKKKKKPPQLQLLHPPPPRNQLSRPRKTNNTFQYSHIKSALLSHAHNTCT